MVDGVPSADYKKPFHLYPYNRPSEQPLPAIKPIKLQKDPIIPVRWNRTMNLRTRIHRDFLKYKKKRFWEFKVESRLPGEITIKYPRIETYHNRTSQYRYKWVREIPVVPCRFTEHVMTYKKPPFVNPVKLQRCGDFALRNYRIGSPKKSQMDQDLEFLPDILM